MIRPDVPVLMAKAIASVAHAVEIAGASSQAISQCTSDVAAAIERALAAPRVRCIDLLAQDAGAELAAPLDLELLQREDAAAQSPQTFKSRGSALVCDISTPNATQSVTLISSPCKFTQCFAPLELAEADAGAGTPLGAASKPCSPGMLAPHTPREAWTSCRLSGGLTKPKSYRPPTTPQLCKRGGSALVCDISTPKATQSVTASFSPHKCVPIPAPLELAQADAGAGTPFGADGRLSSSGLSTPHILRDAWKACRISGGFSKPESGLPTTPQAKAWLTAGATASASVQPFVEALEPVANGHTPAVPSVVKAAEELLRRCWLFELAALGASSPGSTAPTLEELSMDFERWLAMAGYSSAATD